ncbi:MAG: hypothetical protein ACFCU1_11025 [Sumerlaeia bacterium]
MNSLQDVNWINSEAPNTIIGTQRFDDSTSKAFFPYQEVAPELQLAGGLSYRVLANDAALDYDMPYVVTQNDSRLIGRSRLSVKASLSAFQVPNFQVAIFDSANSFHSSRSKVSVHSDAYTITDPPLFLEVHLFDIQQALSDVQKISILNPKPEAKSTVQESLIREGITGISVRSAILSWAPAVSYKVFSGTEVPYSVTHHASSASGS